jgi:hypothetical protein
MDLVGLITQLKANVPVFAGRVAGAAEFSTMMAGELRPEGFPSAYVIPLSMEATDNDTPNALYQVVTERVGIAVEFDNTGDRRGQGVTQLYWPTFLAINAAILNWRGTDPEHTLRGFESAGGSLLSNDRARIFYQYDYTIEWVLTEIDGWPVPYSPLNEIDANDPNAYPNAPKPPFKVVFLQP